MRTLLIGLLAMFVWVNPRVLGAAAEKETNPSSTASPTQDPVERAYEKLLEDDDAAQEEADKWIRESKAFEAKGAPFSEAALAARIQQRFGPIKKAYEDFLQQHPNHVRARLAYGSFLYETQDEDDGVAQWDKARETEPTNPAPWNNLANHYGHRGPVKKAFEYYAKAIELKPDEPVYLQNFATTVYLFRKDAMEFYNIDEKQVFDKSLELYRKALKLDPKNFPLATDYAQSYYGIKPLRTDDALSAWKYALKVANDDFEREGVYVHLARVELNSGLFPDAHKHLNMVTNEFYTVLKERLNRNLLEKEKKGTNSTPNEPAALDFKPEVAPPQPSSSRPAELSSGTKRVPAKKP